ncbi:hypothetical protein [Bradyrhizobium guangdongense]|uniref:Uncharacterized protein n=1 Tax=Bradyrhizobium guangdongense TaxID=1325090 RepID=A0A410V751_9BRAD|nr:hypothetical protein [Bradyrhizobium guangdongense]QAU39450.1 hypothetical protein X265_18610 [Bradyrhizobium guangdongense]QOZ60510.1 hypothetical protein XH86_18620 [Bradyrhizobium guangdongense]GGI23807.1 hypothetical protein GCM10010987_26230 [Bradyrhizobium guangdongense]
MSQIANFPMTSRHAHHAKVFSRMESDVCDLERMGHIALSQIQECRSPDDRAASRELELAVFAVAQLFAMASAFRMNYEAAYRGEEWPE